MLVYLMGASGAGKDSILRASRERYASDNQLFFAHRYITRTSGDGSENHISLSPTEFTKYVQAGFFCLHWHSHGLSYGVGIEVAYWLEAGKTVVVNGSRAHLDSASQRFGSRLLPVMVTVSPQLLRARLVARGRETGVQIEQRLQRAAQYDQVTHPRLHVLSNNGTVAEAVSQLDCVLRSLPHQTPVASMPA